MHKPSDQAKLLFFALLRGTVSALATEPKVASSAAMAGLAVKQGSYGLAAVRQHHQPPALANIQLRLARRCDVPSIQKCNLATLPENYNSQFYANHMRQWPDLCLVAEDMSLSTQPEQNENRPNNANLMDHTHSIRSSFPPPFGLGSPKTESNVVAYVLGKVEERPRRVVSSGFYSEGYDPRDDYNENHQNDDEERFIGHVTSLAVLKPYRRQGLAAALMKQLHFHLEECHGANAVGLHVRKSNQAACRLYQDFGYQIDLTIPGYYQDGEDAYFMKKPLQLTNGAAASSARHNYGRQGSSSVVLNNGNEPASSLMGARFPFLGRSRPQGPWENGPMELRLPRDLEPPHRNSNHHHNNGEQRDDPAAADEHNNPGLVTGSLY